jgi:hypothetical protein
VAWCNLYVGIEGRAGSDNTFLAKKRDLELEEPEWKGLEGIEITRLKSAAEQLIHVDTKRNQQPVRNYAPFMVLHHTDLRMSELLALNLSQ